jgi:hypothetical protein
MGSGVDESGASPWFQEQYKYLRVDDLRVVKSPGEDGILAITGATISSDAVTGSVKDGLAMLLSIVGVEGTFDAARDVTPGGAAARAKEVGGER